jgi:hypothetical protein
MNFIIYVHRKITDVVYPDHVTGCRVYNFNCWVRQDFFRDIQTYFYQHERRLYGAIVPAHIDVTLDVTDTTFVSVNGLLRRGLYTLSERRDEPPLCLRISVGYGTFPESVREISLISDIIQ